MSVIIRSLGVLIFFLAALSGRAQTTIDIPIGQVLDAGGGGLLLANGVRARGEIVTTGTGTAGANMGDWNVSPASLGGTFNGTILPGADVSSVPGSFTRIQTPSNLSIDRGGVTGVNYRDSIGFHIQFDTPLRLHDLLMVDIDGINGVNAEWVTGFGYNGNSFVNSLISAPGPLITIENAVINGGGTWSAMLAATLDQYATAAALPAAMNIVYTTGGSDYDPDNAASQAILSFDQAVTDFYLMWGVRGSPGSASSQNSGVSALRVDFTPVPEPGAAALLALTATGMLLRRRR